MHLSISYLFLRANVWQARYRQAVAALEPFPANDSFTKINKQCKALHASLSLESHLLRFIAKGKGGDQEWCSPFD